ncbi:hypothetical protein ACG7TL_002849 [Trametes sanguinea]
MSPRIDPPYPSFTFALSKTRPTLSPPPESIVIRPSDARTTSRPPSLRLPPYRASHTGRFHPYPRSASPRRGEDQLMNTVDYRYAEEPLWEEDTVVEADSDTPAYEENLAAMTVALREVDIVSPGSHAEPATTRAPSKAFALSKSAFLMTLSDMLAALRRRYLSTQAMQSFLETQQFKSG